MRRTLKLVCVLSLPLTIALASQGDAAQKQKAPPKWTDKVYTQSIASTKFEKPKAASSKPKSQTVAMKSTAQKTPAKSSAAALPRTGKHEKAVPASDAHAFTAQGGRPSREVVRQSTQATASNADGTDTSVGQYGQTVYHSIHDWSPGSLDRPDPAATRTASSRTRKNNKEVRGDSPRERAQEVDDRK